MYLTVAVLGWGQGAQAPQILPRPPKFFQGKAESMMISIVFRLAVVTSQMMRGQPTPQHFS